MAGYNSKLADKEFINWIKAHIALGIVKNGIEDYTVKEVNDFHSEVYKSIQTTNQNNDSCAECTIQNLLPCKTSNICNRNGKCYFHEDKNFRTCPKGICSLAQGIIKQNHINNIPSWKNTRAEEWHKNPWEMAKCYMPPGAYMDKTNIGDTDMNGILSLFLNHSRFKKMIDKSICVTVREMGNGLRHCSSLHVSDKTLLSYLSTLQTFLKCFDPLRNDTVKLAEQEIEKLKTDKISITQDDVTKVLEKSIEEERKRCSEDLSKEKESILQNLTEALNEVKKSSIQDIERTKKEAIENIRTEISTGKEQIELKTEASIAQIEAAKHQATCQIRLSYEEELKMLKDDLMDFNCSHHSTIQITPLLEETDVPIPELYVRPDFVVIERQSLFGHTIRIPTNSLQDIFFKGGSVCNEVYLTSDAGIGKTSFCNFLAITWYHALNSDERNHYFLEADIDIMKGFDLVFLITLRNVNIECDIDDMIFMHVISRLSHSKTFSIEFLQDVLSKERCLIILDGLDEWSHPSVSSCSLKMKTVPHRKVRRKCTVLTTTRPWNYGSLTIKTSQIDKRVELCCLNASSIARLKENAISKLVDDNDLHQVLKKLNAEINDRGIANLESNPMLLMFLICLSCEKTTLGRSKSELYCQIIELLLTRAEQKSGHDTTAVGAVKQDVIPRCFEEHHLCLKNYQLLKCIGELAYNTLFNESRSNTLVFDKSNVSLSKEHLNVSLASGILTETKSQLSLFKQQSKISFCHKTVQEFFAALYIETAPVQEEMIKKTIKVCNSVDRVLEMSNVFVFLCGLNHKTFGRLSEKLNIVVNDDENVRQYRHGCISSTSNYNFIIKPLKDIQNMYLDCMKESEKQTLEQLHLCLQDVFINGDCCNESYKLNLSKLKTFSKDSMKSLSVRTEGISNLHDVVETFQLSEDTSLVKVNFRGNCSNKDIDCLLAGSARNLKCVEILSSEWTGRRFVVKYTEWMDTLCNTFQRMSHLEALHLYAFDMTHSQLTEMFTFIGQKTKLKDIALLNLRCCDDNITCTGFHLDLSKHKTLRLLSLDNLPISQVTMNVSALEEIVIGLLPNSNVSSAFLQTLKSATSVHKFTCRNIVSTPQIDEIIETLQGLVNLRYIGILYVNFGDRNLILPDKMSNIELIRLFKVTITCSFLRNLVMIIKTFVQPVTVELNNCTVIPEDEYQALKKEIKSDGQIYELLDSANKPQNEEFIFKNFGTKQH